MKFKILTPLLFLSLSLPAVAGVDLSSTIERIKINGDGKLWLKMTSRAFYQYCKPGWYGFNLYIPETDKSYPYYYGLITTALAKEKPIHIANIPLCQDSCRLN